jgi:hypothetical protein
MLQKGGGGRRRDCKGSGGHAEVRTAKTQSLFQEGDQVMATLNIGIEIRDFDLERMGFSLSVLDESKKRQASEAYLRMTLMELHVFINALKNADGRDIELTTYDSNGVNKLPPMKAVGNREVEPEPRGRRSAAE